MQCHGKLFSFISVLAIPLIQWIIHLVGEELFGHSIEIEF